MENQNERDEIEIDLVELFYVLWGHVWLILSIGLFCALSCFALSKFIIAPTYKSTTKIYILNKSDSSSVTYSDVQLGTQLTKDYAELINSRYVLEAVIQELGLNMEYKDLLKKIDVTTPSDTRIVSITVEDHDPVQAMNIANSVRENASTHIQNVTSFFTRFSNIVNFEWELRFNKKFNRFLKKATLRYPQASFDDTIYEPDRQLDTATIEQLATCKWLDEGRNLLITGATGAGKSYLSNALCVAAIRQFKTVKYIRANTMMSEMDQARIKGTYLEYVNHMARLDLLVIDDFGLMDLDLDKCRDFFEVIDSRDSQKSTIIVSQLPVKSWYDLFADNTYADACLDRMVHKAFRLELNGKNMRNPV